MLPLSLYQRALGPAYQRLAPALARFHRLSGPHRLAGQVQVEAPATWLGRVLAWALGAPQRAVQGAAAQVLEPQGGDVEAIGVKSGFQLAQWVRDNRPELEVRLAASVDGAARTAA